MQPEVNIGTLGHVDHGKTTIVEALTGVWTDVHSMEIKYGISIKLGYADAEIRRCPACAEPECWGTEPKCRICDGPTRCVRKVSFVDAPGHETLMTTVLASAAIIDGALFVIAANERCPAPQTIEHKAVLDVMGIKNIVIAQNKIDLVTKDVAAASARAIRRWLAGSAFENAPIIPVSAHYRANIDVLIAALERCIPTPPRNRDAPPVMYIARSFDVNRPGTPIERLCGGVVGGSLAQGVLRVGDDIEIVPGLRGTPLYTRINSLRAGTEQLDVAGPGGLIAVGTTLDPSLTKADALVGAVVGHVGATPPIHSAIDIEYTLLERVDFENKKFVDGEQVVISCGTATTIGEIKRAKKEVIEVALRRPICAHHGAKLALSRKVGARWRLAAAGVLG